MAIFSLKTLVAASGFTALTAAFPMAVDKRDAVTSWWTQTDYTTVDVPVTLWVDEQGHPLFTGAPQGGVFAEKTGHPAAITPVKSPKVEIRQTGTVYTGDITYYGGGLGACGWNVNTDTDFQIAMPYGMMGLASNDNPYCGKSVTIQNPNTLATVQVTVGDKCMGCEGGSIDLTEVVFNTIGGGCDGRCHGFEWWFN